MSAPDQSVASGGPPPTAEAQDPLPESLWLYRRLFTFAVAAVLLAFVWVYAEGVSAVALGGSETAIRGLVHLLQASLGLIAMLILFYLLAPSAEQLTKLVQTGAALRSGIAFRSTTTAVAPDGSSAVARSEAAPAETLEEPIAEPLPSTPVLFDEAERPPVPENEGDQGVATPELKL